VRKLKPGLPAESVSPVFEADKDSWGFVMLEDRRAAGPQPLDQTLYQKINQQLIKDVIARKELEWFRKALQKSLILDGQASPRPIPLRFFLPDEPDATAGKKDESKKQEPAKKDSAKKDPPPATKKDR
jgi:hypothetical protein